MGAVTLLEVTVYSRHRPMSGYASLQEAVDCLSYQAQIEEAGHHALPLILAQYQNLLTPPWPSTLFSWSSSVVSFYQRPSRR